ncbi:MAG: RHS repeat-associated core domain-containing protein, partial [Firmicutes bacterium]|nr:RHS repeat-associated core domain-containing protein [Bacillota bacterium]
MSRRVRKEVREWDGSNWILQTNEKYVYSGWNLVAVYNGRNSDALLRTYTWGTDISGTVGGAGGIGGLLSVQEHSGTYAGKTYLYNYDATGNVTQLVDAADGTIVAQYRYDPYGKTRVATGNGYEQVNPFRYQTKFTDDSTQLIYYGYRYYSHSMGRFLNQDPLGEQGGLNLYAFVGNDPINAREYLGLSELRGDWHWWRDGLGHSGDGNSNWRKILSHAYNMYYDSWSATQRNDFQVETLAAYWHSDTNRHDEASLDQMVGNAVHTAIAKLMSTSNGTIEPVTAEAASGVVASAGGSQVVAPSDTGRYARGNGGEGSGGGSGGG